MLSKKLTVNRFLRCFFWLSSLSIVSQPSFALGKLGHQIVCQLAFDHLPVNKQEKIKQLLATTPKKHQVLINRYNYIKKGSAITFANACTWADAIKHTKKFSRYNSWHYLNVPRNQTFITSKTCQENCLPQAILLHQKALAQKDQPATWSQTKALMFLGHWLGDIHQPLHISFTSDLGGNKIKLSHVDIQCTNLHWYWDDCLLYRGKNSKAQWLELLTLQWQQNGRLWQPIQVWQWADESFQLIKKPSFNYCHMDNQGHCQAPKKEVILPQGYFKKHQGIMEQRLLLAAKRLTQILSVSL